MPFEDTLHGVYLLFESSYISAKEAITGEKCSYNLDHVS